MATITVDIKALTGSFSTDLKRVERESKGVFANIEREAARVGRAIGAGLAVGVTALAALTKRAINTADEMGKAAQRIGIATPELSKLSYAAKLADVDLKQLSSGIVQLTKRMAENKDVFAAIGVQVTDVSGKLRKANDVFVDVAEVFAGMEDGATKTRLAVDLFGKSGAQLIPLLNEGRDGLKGMGDEAERLGVVISDNTAKAAEQFNDDLTRLGVAFDGIFIKVAQDVLPVLNDLAAKFQDPQFREGLAAIASGAATAIVEVVKLIGELGNLSRFAGEAIAARVNGPANDDIVRLEDAIERQRAVIAQLDQKGTGAERRNTSSFADEQRLELLNLTAQLNAARDAAEALAIQQFKLDEASQVATDGAREQSQAEKDAIEAKRLLEGRLQAYIGKLGESSEANRELARAERERAKALREAEADWKSLDDLHQRELMSLEEQARAMRDVRAEFDLAAKDIETETELLGMSTAERRKAIIALEAERLARAKSGAEYDRFVKLLTDQDNARSIASILGDKSEWERVLDRIEEVGEALRIAMAEGSDDVAQLQNKLAQLNAEMQIGAIESFKALLGAMQTFTKEGSNGFKNIEKGMAALSLVQDIIALKAAVTAVLTQGEGEPYSAWARMAAMAAAVAPILASIGQTITSFGGGSFSRGSTADARQETQGTGTVLGDFEAKSESIANAIEITAEATSQLVGISTGMLRALQAMEASIGGASNQLARGVGDVEFGALPKPFNFAQHSVGANILGFSLAQSLLGGRSEVTDQGILIMGGALSDMIENISVGAFQEVQSRSWRFGSTRTREEVQDLSDDVAVQFQLVLDSMADAVAAGAEALGMDMAEVNAAIAAFEIEEIRISTMDLSAEEAQAELEAVFSSIFDGLAGSVVPFIDQFQRVGEGLGETLVRVATSVQVTQEAVTQLGLSLEELDPESMAQVSVALIDAVGSIEDFIQGMQSFVANFAPESHRFAVAQDAVTRAFAQVGLTLPDTRDGLWLLMQSLDATTETGREQIATLLRLADTADAYYDQLERDAESAARAAEAQRAATQDYAEFIDQFGAAFRQGSPFQQALQDVRRELAANIATANELARAAGLQGAREEDLIGIRELAQAQIADLITGLTETVIQQIADLYGTSAEQLESQIADLDAQIAALDRSDSSFGMLIAMQREEELGRERLRLQEELQTQLESEERLRRQLGAMDLAQNLADLGLARGVGLDQLAGELGLNLERFGADLGLTADGVRDLISTLEADSLTADVFGQGVQDIVEAINLITRITDPKPITFPDDIDPAGRGGKARFLEVPVEPEAPIRDEVIDLRTAVETQTAVIADLLKRGNVNTATTASQMQEMVRTAVREAMAREVNRPRNERVISRPKAGR
jgi:hypothetical protein